MMSSTSKTPWAQSTGFSVNPAGATYPTNPAVYTLSSDGQALFVGGNFTTYRGLPAACLAKVDLQSGVLDQTFT